MGDKRPRKRLRIRSSTSPNGGLSIAPYHRHLCQSCMNLGLEEMFVKEVDERCIGTLADWSAHQCPFAEVVLKSISLARGPASKHSNIRSLMPLNPLIYIQSKGWILKQGRNRQKLCCPRILLAISERPSHAAIPRTGKALIDKTTDRYIISELELLERGSLHMPSSGEQNAVVSPPPRRPIAPDFDCSIAKDWLEHTPIRTTRNPKPTKGPLRKSFWTAAGFRLIDVVEQCLVVKTEFCEYTALSYVWGATADSCLALTSLNVSQLSRPRAFATESMTSSSKPVARTIVDAMELLRKVGQRYLWVDVLCILQDDPEEKQRLIHGMDQVYENANLTIIAVAGEDANAGLPGITRRDYLPYEQHFGWITRDNTPLKLAICPPSLSEQVKNSKWDSRGWTYQEQCLSHRCIYFTPDEVFFLTRKHHWRESYACEEHKRKSNGLRLRTGAPWWTRRIIRDPEPSPYRPVVGANPALGYNKYEKIVKDYCQKNLRYSSDVFNAFQGILNRFCSSGDKDSIQHCQNIPLDFLPPALLWYPLDGSQKRGSCTIAPFQRFSSWSWVSWEGPIDFLYSDRSGLDKGITTAAIAFEMWNSDSFFIKGWGPLTAHERDRKPKKTGPFSQARLNEEEATNSAHYYEKGLIDLKHGVLSFQAPCLLTNTAIPRVSESNNRLWHFSLANHSDDSTLKVNFRPDENIELHEALGLVALLQGQGPACMVVVLGIRLLDNNTYERVGIGTTYRSPSSLDSTSLADFGFEQRGIRMS
ncbi:heterokaryon incompatibility protein-domain-containing protein [Nemania abortiva]|nr:heterokaryon incompatibility protein-domain-containing protein [Nemania abortiva]